MVDHNCIAPDVELGQNIKLSSFINLYGCKIGDNTKIGAFVEIQKNAEVGKNCKISSHTFICEGVTIEDEAFIGHSVTFINDSYPRATTGGQLQTEEDWKLERTIIKKGASIGSGSTILSNVVIGENALVGAGSVVTKDVPANAIVAGNPAKLLRFIAPQPNSVCEAHDKIAFLDLVGLHQALEGELVPVFQKVLRTASFIGGPMVEEFERGFAQFCDVAHCIGVGSGTDALRFALMAAGVQPGDIVVTVPNTFIATAEAVSQAGARPDFVDVDERTYTLDPSKLQQYLETFCYREQNTGKLLHKISKAPVTAVVPVHLYGQMADMDQILDIARNHNLIVIEDACQGHGAEYFSKKENRWRKAGSMGVAAAFSFYPGKNLGACGEAGAVTTNHEEVACKVRKLRDHGQAKKYYHEIEGYNGRLDALQAGLLTLKLRYLPEWNQRRQIAARRYDEQFLSIEGVITPHRADWCRPVYHLYVIRVQQRAELQKHLSAVRIDTGIHYPVPLHLQKAYEGLGYKFGDFPTAEQAASEILSLPMFPQITAEQQARVVEEIGNFLQTHMLQAGEMLTSSNSNGR